MKSSFAGLRFLALICLVGCSAAQSDPIGSECISDRGCPGGEVCKAGRCTESSSPGATGTTSGAVRVTGAVEGAPEGVQIETASGDDSACEMRDDTTLACELDRGGAITLIAPEVDGYRFKGWSGDEGCSGDQPSLTLKKVSRNTTCTAGYARRLRVSGTVLEAPEFSVRASSESETASCDEASCEVDVGDTVVLAAPERDGYRITGFDGEGCGERDGYRVTVTTVDSDVVCNATYVESLTVRGQTQGLREEDARRVASQVVATALSEGALCEGQLCAVDPGQSVVLAAQEVDSYRFRGWTGDAPCLSTETTVQLDDVQTNVVCSADYVPRYRVTGVSEGADAPITGLSENLFSTCEGATCTVDSGESVTLQAGTVEGYRLKEWTGDGCEALSGASAIARTVELDVMCTAHYVEGVSVTGTVVNAEGEVSASSDSPGADCERGSCAIDVGGSATLIAPDLPGRTFVGWSGDPGCTGKSTTLTLSNVTTSKSCSATFAARFTVSARPEPARGGSVTATSASPNARCTAGTRCEVDEGSTVVLNAVPNTNFRFTGWSGGGPCVGSAPRLDLAGVKASVTCSANFVARIKVSSAVAPANAGTTTASQLSLTAECARTTCTVDAGSNVTLTATAADGYRFTRWSGCGSSLNPLLDNPNLLVLGPTTDTTCTANFDKLTYPVTVTAQAGGSVQSSVDFVPCPGNVCTVEHNGSAGIAATPDGNHDFAGWTGTNCNPGADGTLRNIKAAVMCTARFTEIPSYTVTGKTEGASSTFSATSAGGSCSGTSCTNKRGSSVTLTVPDADPPGYRYGGWTCSNGATGGRQVVVSNLSGNVTCTASYTLRQWTVRVTVDPPGSGSVSCAAPLGCVVNDGAMQTVTADPASSYLFTNWTGDCLQWGANLSATLTVTRDMNCVANFDVAPF